MLDTILHNSRDKAFREPQGALPCGERVRLSIQTPAEARARLRVWENGREIFLEGEQNGAMTDFIYQAPNWPGLVWYYFVLDTPFGTKYYSGRSGRGGLYNDPPASYQITVYDAAFETPKWFTGGIVYQIFPDRFKRGKGKGGLARLEHHRRMDREVREHRDWDEEVEYLPAPGKGVYEPNDFYGGDIAGIIEGLPYIKGLGVNCIYLNPIFESSSNHRYNTSDYHKIDPVLGTELDFFRLCSEARKMGIRIMLDGVFSHTGDDSIYFDRFHKYGGGAVSDENSPYREWYEFAHYPDAYRCWWGFRSLPEVNENVESYRQFIRGVVRHWARCGATAWRLDVADELPDEFIEMLRAELKSLDKDAVLIGEVWEEASNKHGFGYRRRYTDGMGLDGVMAYPFKDALLSFLAGYIDAFELYDRLSMLREAYPEPFYAAQLNILDSHDTIRACTVLSGAPHRDALTREAQAVYRPTEAMSERGRALMRLAVTLQMAMPGVPCIYYGDEAGMTGMADPFNRRTFPWEKGDESLLAHYKAVTAARSRRCALKFGRAGFLAVSEDVFAIIRADGAETVLTIVNRSGEMQRSFVRGSMFREGPDGGTFYLQGTFRDAFTAKEYRAALDTISIELLPRSGMMLVFDEGGLKE